MKCEFPDNVQESIGQLRRKGLNVEYVNNMILISRPIPAPDDPARTKQVIDGNEVMIDWIRLPDGTVDWYADVTNISTTEEGYQFQNNPPGYFPGPNEDATTFRTVKFEDVIAAADQYYFGKPIVVEGWRIPIHRHPQWKEDRVKKSIHWAPLVSKEDADRFADESLSILRACRPKWGQPKVKLEDPTAYFIHTIERVDGTKWPKMYLRGDCERAVIWSE